MAVARLLDLAGHPLAALTRERSPGLVPRDRHALLDGHAARAAGLDLQERGLGREVGAGADLEAAAALERGQQVRIHVGGVVVGGGVALGHLAVDVQDQHVLREVAQNRRGRGGVQRVLAVHSGQHRRALIQFIEADRVEVGENRVQGGVHESCPWWWSVWCLLAGRRASGQATFERTSTRVRSFTRSSLTTFTEATDAPRRCSRAAFSSAGSAIARSSWTVCDV